MKKFCVFGLITLWFISCSMNYDHETSTYTTKVPGTNTPVRVSLGEPEQAPVQQPSVVYTYSFYYGTPDSVSSNLSSTASSSLIVSGEPELISSSTRTTNGVVPATWDAILDTVEYTVPSGYLEDYWWYTVNGSDVIRLNSDDELSLTHYDFYLALYDKDNGIRAPFPDGVYHFVDFSRPESTAEQSLKAARCFKVEGNYVYFDFGHYGGGFTHNLVPYLVVDYKYYPECSAHSLFGTALLLKKDGQYYGMYFAFNHVGSRWVSPHAPIPFEGPLPDDVVICARWQDKVYSVYHDYYNINARYSLD